MPADGRVAADAMKHPSAALTPLQRSAAFAKKLNCTCPIVLAPMSGISGTDLSVSVMTAGGVGGCGAVNMAPKQIRAWARELRERSDGPYQINLWVPGDPNSHDVEVEEGQRAFLRKWGPEPRSLESVPFPSYEEQCQAVLEARPTIASSIMGLFHPAFVDQLKSAGIAWWATVTTAKEALDAADAGADAIIVQGLEAGGHRGSFDPGEALTQQVGLFALLPHVCDAVTVPVIAAGGIADGRTVAAALALGASGVQIGTGFLCTEEARMPDVYRNQLNALQPHNAVLTASFTGRHGRVVSNSFVEACRSIDAPPALPFPEQFLLTQAMREEAALQQDPQRMAIWAGQSAALAESMPASKLTEKLWKNAINILSRTDTRSTWPLAKGPSTGLTLPATFRLPEQVNNHQSATAAFHRRKGAALKSLIRNSVTLAYEDNEACRPVLVLLHGWGCDHSTLSRQRSHFDGTHRVINVDLRGHGQSDKPDQEYTVAGYADDVVWMLDCLGIERASFLGHSMGGAIALEIGSQHPERVSSAVLIDTAFEAPTAVERRLAPLLPGLQEPEYAQAYRNIMEALSLDSDLSELTPVLSALPRAPQHVLLSALHGHMVQHAFAIAAESFHRPLAYIAASTSLANLTQLRRLVPHIDCGQVVGAGHFAPWIVADQVNSMVRRFLELHADPSALSAEDNASEGSAVMLAPA